MPLRPPRASNWPVTWTCPAPPPGVLTLPRCCSPLFCSSGYWKSSLECNKVTFTGNPRKRRKCMFVLKLFVLLLLSLLHYLWYKHEGVCMCVCVCLQDPCEKQNVRMCIYVYRCQISFTVGIHREFCQVGGCLLLILYFTEIIHPGIYIYNTEATNMRFCLFLHTDCYWVVHLLLIIALFWQATNSIQKPENVKLDLFR